MAKPLSVAPKAFNATVYIFLLALSLSCANSARLLDEMYPTVAGQPAATIVPPIPTMPSGQIPVPVATTASAATTTPSVAPAATVVADENADPPLPDTEVPPTVEVPVADVAAPIPGPTTTSLNGPASTVAATAATATSPTLSFFMHDVLGGTHPSVRVVTGIIARTDINGIPFSQPNNNFFPLQGGTPLLNINNLNNLINPNTAPLLTGLNGAQANTVLQNTGNSNNVVNGDNQPFVTAGQLPASATLQKLMFGSITVIDDELTEGHELGSGVMGRAQGFYLASSLDGNSHTMAFTVLLHAVDHELVDDTISFFGVHRTASPISQIAVVGGTGKYENARGYATVETLLHQEDQHTTDGVDTVMHIAVYLSEY